MKEFSFIKIETKKYPTIIMGEDQFTGWFKKCKKYNSEKERAVAYKQTIEVAYSKGVRGFSMSPHPTLIKILKHFKMKHPNIVCIANPHWHKNYYLHNESLWSNENMEKLKASEIFYGAKSLIKNNKFKETNIKKIFSREEIDLFRLDEKEYLEQLNQFNFCDFILIGNLGKNALIHLEREDIIKREIKLVRDYGRIPIGICEDGGLNLSKYEKMNISGTWILLNKYKNYPKLNDILKIIKKSKKPLTAYRIFVNPKGFNLENPISFIKNINQIKSIVVGVENKEQAEKTFSKLNKLWN